NHKALKNMIDYYQKHTTFSNFIPHDGSGNGSENVSGSDNGIGSENGSNLVNKMENDIHRWKREIWYLYFTEKVYKDMFINAEELEIKKQELAEENMKSEKVLSDFNLAFPNFNKF
ncbi:MAG: hypothetical protein WD512_09160, partial [Candidatus Paceibacterota bacterium]